MDNKELEPWPEENIPDDDDLFMRAHKMHFNGGKLMPGVFRDQGGAMSTDWCKYATPEQTLSRGKVPDDNAAIAFMAGSARRAGMVVRHTPDRENDNRAHADVIGDKKSPEFRIKLLRESRILLCGKHLDLQ